MRTISEHKFPGRFAPEKISFLYRRKCCKYGAIWLDDILLFVMSEKCAALEKKISAFCVFPREREVD